MPRYRNVRTGAVIRVPAVKVERLGEGWEEIIPTPPKPKRRRKKD